VRVYRVKLDVVKPRVEAEMSDTLPLPDKPSIAVLPFTNMSGDPEQEYFSDGITEDIITALSCFRWFFVISRNSTFAYIINRLERIRLKNSGNSSNVLGNFFLDMVDVFV